MNDDTPQTRNDDTPQTTNDDTPLSIFSKFSKFVSADPRVVMGLGLAAAALSLALSRIGLGGLIVRTGLTFVSVAAAGVLVYALLAGDFRSDSDAEIYERVIDDDD